MRELNTSTIKEVSGGRYRVFTYPVSGPNRPLPKIPKPYKWQPI